MHGSTTTREYIRRFVRLVQMDKSALRVDTSRQYWTFLDSVSRYLKRHQCFYSNWPSAVQTDLLWFCNSLGSRICLAQARNGMLVGWHPGREGGGGGVEIPMCILAYLPNFPFQKEYHLAAIIKLCELTKLRGAIFAPISSRSTEMK